MKSCRGKLTMKIVDDVDGLSLIHISEPTRQAEISYAVFCKMRGNPYVCLLYTSDAADE